jgi:hypothetical protein
VPAPHRRQQSVIDRHVIARHSIGGESLLERLAALPAVEIPGAAHGLDSLFDRIHDEPRAAVIDQLGHGPVVPRDGGRPSRQAFDDHHAERLGPVDREQQRSGASEQGPLLLFRDFAQELDAIRMKQRLDDLGEVLLIDLVHLGRDL